jgi:DNA-binding GntR family transcriptional regulator
VISADGGIGQQEGVVAALRAAIVAGSLSPRERLVELDLAEQFGVGRAVIRAALIELCKEGLVEREVNRGARVRAISLEEAIELTELRALLEGFCARKAAERATPAERLELRSMIGSMHVAVAAREYGRYDALNGQLHRMIREVSRHRAAESLCEHVLNQSIRQAYQVRLVKLRMSASFREHLRIVEAIDARQGALAERAMRAHIDSVRRDLMEAWQAAAPSGRK